MSRRGAKLAGIWGYALGAWGVETEDSCRVWGYMEKWPNYSFPGLGDLESLT